MGIGVIERSPWDFVCTEEFNEDTVLDVTELVFKISN